jgi:hypothetical protein
MKKVAIISCYFQHNYGSMLQAYATQMALNKLGYDNETIDISGFRNEIKKRKIKYFIKASLTSDILISKFGMAKNLIIKKFSNNDYSVNSNVRNEKFDEFARRYFILSKQYDSITELGNESKENYSSVLVGSDQLWLPANIAADYYTLNFVPENINTVAYATSFGQSELPNDISKKAKVFLSKIKHIGVREESGKKLIYNLVNRNVPVVCDPTLLFTGEEWMSIQKEEAIINEPYIFCYFLGNNPPHREFAKRLKEETGCKIVALLHLDEFIKSDENYADEMPYNVGPSEFLNLIRNATYVCTDSFHCSVFSMLYKKTFFAFRRYARKTMSSTNSRLDTLFQLAGLKGRIMEGNEDIKSCLQVSIDYDAVHNNLEQIRMESYKYIINALKDENSTDLV